MEPVWSGHIVWTFTARPPISILLEPIQPVSGGKIRAIASDRLESKAGRLTAKKTWQFAQIAGKSIRLQLWNELIELRPAKTPKSVTAKKIEAVKVKLLTDRDLWHYFYCKFGNHYE